MEWISINDKLPSIKDPVIISCLSREEGHDYSFTWIAWYAEGKWYDMDKSYFPKGLITHWMPLPKSFNH